MTGHSNIISCFRTGRATPLSPWQPVCQGWAQTLQVHLCLPPLPRVAVSNPTRVLDQTSFQSLGSFMFPHTCHSCLQNLALFSIKLLKRPIYYQPSPLTLQPTAVHLMLSSSMETTLTKFFETHFASELPFIKVCPFLASVTLPSPGLLRPHQHFLLFLPHALLNSPLNMVTLSEMPSQAHGPFFPALLGHSS